MIKIPTHRRSPLASALIFVVGLSVSILLLSLLRLDIGAYKQQLAQRLEWALDKPVRLGDASLSFHGGIALDFRNLSIGDNAEFSLHIPQLTALLEPYALLRGEIVIEQVLLEYPSLKLGLPLKLAKSEINLERLGLKSLQVRKGSLILSYPGAASKPLRIENLNIVLHSLGRGLVSQLATTATLFQYNHHAELKAFLELERQESTQPWRQSRLSGNVKLSQLRSQLLETLGIVGLPEVFDIAFDLEGTPADQVRLTAELSSASSDVRLISLSSDWRSDIDHDDLLNLKLGLAGIPLQGNLRLDRGTEEPLLSGRIDLGETRIGDLMAAAPRHPLSQLQGKISHFSAEISGPLRGTEQNPYSPLQKVQLKLRDLSYPSHPLELSDTSFDLELREGRLSLDQGQGYFGGSPFHFSGHTSSLADSSPDIELQLNTEADLAQLQQKIDHPYWQRQQFKGPASLNILLQGTLNNLSGNATLDLTPAAIGIGKVLDKAPDIPLQITLNAQLLPNRLRIRSAGLLLAETQLEFSGDLRQRDRNWDGTLQLSPFEIATLQPLSPICEFFRIVGKLQGRLELGGSEGFSGHFSIAEGGARLTRILGDLNQVSGDFLVNPEGIRIDPLDARLGDSRLQINGSLKNWRSPLLGLHVTASEVRAQDLIFTHPQMMLQDLDGQLLINRGGITFSSIDVSVEQKTRAHVEGQMRGYRDPQTYLEVSSDEADILDIIRLFTGPTPSAPPQAEPNDASLELKARVAKGTLGSFHFENAAGTIHEKNRLFTLYPLDFSLDAGRVSGRVELDRQRNNLLKLSGFAQNCDADRVYTMLFEKEGIFKGTLDGHFYLEGEEIGESFWKTAKGGGRLRIRDGVMRELKGFAEIFSLLNVSQLFKFQLPDMDKEGLPFSELTATARMTNGILHYNDFRIESPAINISAVGRIDSLQQTIDSTIGIKPLRTVDIILSRVPLFGWVLTGEEEALITALFTLKGPLKNPQVSAAPVSSVTRTALGIIGRALSLPFHMLKKTNEFLTTPPRQTSKPDLPVDPAPQN